MYHLLLLTLCNLNVIFENQNPTNSSRIREKLYTFIYTRPVKVFVPGLKRYVKYVNNFFILVQSLGYFKTINLSLMNPLKTGKVDRKKKQNWGHFWTEQQNNSNKSCTRVNKHNNTFTNFSVRVRKKEGNNKSRKLKKFVIQFWRANWFIVLLLMILSR